jgi:hypothetical protein
MTALKGYAHKCMTLGCEHEATAAMHYTMAGDAVINVDNVCAECLESYGNRLAIRIVRTTAPMVMSDVIAPGLV